ncbi:MAG: hypothetical protein E6G41_13445 [Actinobacteria bacterium]|nr:MAG: hypothetical protein E6G41_13445 [Actinomycetota bacterium]
MDADPTVRLTTILDAVVARADEARTRLDGLAARMDELDGGAAPPPAPSVPDPADPIRLAAIELAVAGSTRDQTAMRLRDRYPDAELDPVLDDVFG